MSSRGLSWEVPATSDAPGNRHDYAILPPAPTLLDWVAGAGRKTYGIGKIGRHLLDAGGG